MLAAKKLTLQLGENVILKEVSVSLSAGEVLAVLGPNGAGKSTLLRCLSGELSTQSGSVTLNGDPLESLSATELADQRAVMPQSVQLDFPFSVAEVVEMGQRHTLEKHQSDQILEQALAMFDVLPLKARNYLTLSGGEQQRVQLVRVVAQLLASHALKASANTYLLLDECTSNLDVAHQHLVFKVVKQLAEHHGMGILMILHDLNLASQYADRLVLMKEGKIRYQGTPEAVLTETSISEIYDFPVKVLSPEDGIADWPLVLPLNH